MTAADPFVTPGPRWFTIPAHRPFVDDLAAGLHAALTPLGPEALADAVVLTPTRRGARALAEAFLKAAGGEAVLPPQIRPVGDLEEGEPPFEPGDLALDLAPAVTPLRRRFELARLVAEHPELFDQAPDAPAALEYADALGAFLDAAQLEEVRDLTRLDALADADHARHWLRSAAFLRLAAERWPERLAELGLMDPSARRVALLRALAERWRARPPQGPLVAAGSTGTAPAAADLLRVAAEAPRGLVVLPGLDQELAEAAWAAVDEQHPQGALKRLLERHGLAREDVRVWPASAAEHGRGRARRRLINEALRPAEATADWRAQIETLRRGAAVDPVAEGLHGLSLATARNEEEAAVQAALLLRETLEGGGTAALVTPDAALARRVSARLARWGIEADSSAGAPLAGFPAGVLVALLARAAVDPLDPIVLLGLLKHPYTDFAERSVIRTLEATALRGGRPRSWARLRARLEAAAEPRPGGSAPSPERLARLRAAAELAARLEALLDDLRAPFAAGRSDVPAAARALAHAAERLCGAGSPWRGAAGERAAALLAEMIAEGEALPPVDPRGFEAVTARLLAEETVRTGGSTHPRLRILGAIEARLVRADRMILAGLEEGVWPKPAPTDPFLSRPMRAALGLPPPERRVGLSAHDFAQAACASEVVLLYTERRGGQPAVESRWLWRLKTLTEGAGLHLAPRRDLKAWARALDAPASETPSPAPRPAPRPPVADRPRRLPVTRVETWVRDPYAIYARHVLNLRPMDRPDASVERFGRGQAVHAAVEALVRTWPDALPEDCAGELERLILGALDAEGFEGAALARERPLTRNCAAWLAEFEHRRRASGVRLVVEAEGLTAVDAPAGPFVVTAKADRLEIGPETAAVLDFKTGAPPSRKQVKAGFRPQLSLTGAILARGGFAAVGAPARRPGELAYVRVSGRRPPGQEALIAAGDEAEALSEAAYAGLAALVARFDDPSTPYLSWTAPQFRGDYGGDYDRLARVREWSAPGAEADGGET